MQNFNKIVRSYTLGGIGQNLVYALMTSAYLFYFTEAVGFSAATVGTILLVVRIISLFIDPCVAVLVEKTNTRWGKYKPYVIVMPAIISLLLIALFFQPGFSKPVYLIYIYVITLLFWLAYAFFDIAYWSLVPSITKDESKRVKLLTVCKSGILFAAFGLGITQMPLVNLLGNKNYRTGFLILAIILACLFTIAGWLLSRSLSIIEDENTTNTNSRKKLTLKDILNALKYNDQLIVLIIAKLAIYIPLSIKSALVIYFYKYQLGNDSLGSFASMIALPLTLILISSCPKLLKKYSDKYIMSICVLIQIVLYLIYFIQTDISMFYIVIDGMSSAMLGVYSLFFTNMIATCVEYGEWKTEIRTESIIFSTNTISSKLATGLSGAIAGWVLTGIGYNPGMVQTPQMLMTLKSLLSIVPVAGLLIGILALRYYQLNSDLYQKIILDLSNNTYAKSSKKTN